MKISAAIREYLIEIEVRKYTPKTIRGYRNSLNLFLRFCEQEAHIQEVEEINLAVVRQFSAFMSQKGRKGSYINGLLKVSKSFIQYCYDGGYGGFNTKKNFKWCKQDKAVIVAFKPCDVKQLLQEEQRNRLYPCARHGHPDRTVCCAYHAGLTKGVDKIQCLRGGLFYAAGDRRFLFSVKPRAAAHKFRGREHHQAIWTGNRGCPRVAAHLPPFLRPTAGENGNRPLYHLPLAGA